jgi:lipoprotein-releasing system permease protein
MDGLSWQMALRYAFRSERRFARVVGWVSFGGLFLGVLVLTTVVSVMNGFDAELRARILGSVPHVLVVGAQPEDPRLGLLEDDTAASFGFYLTEGMIAYRGAVNPVAVFAFDPSAADDPASFGTIGANMVYGDLAEALRDPDAAILGAPLAAHLGLREGDGVLLMVSQVTASGVRPALKPLRLAGTFEIGADLDYNLIVTSRDTFTPEDRRASGRDGVRVQLVDPLDAPRVARDLGERMPELVVESWADSYGDLFEAVRLEKAMMFVILLLVVAVAGFNIVSGQTMAVNDKRADIAILRTLGATGRFIGTLFLWQGVAIATFGILAGLVAGCLLAWQIGDVVAVVERWVGMRLLEGTYFVRVPSRILATDVAIIGLTSWAISLLAAWLPARRAARDNPVAALHGA